MAITPYYKMLEWNSSDKKELFNMNLPHECNSYTTCMKIFLMHMTWDEKTRAGWNINSYRNRMELKRRINNDKKRIKKA